MHTSRQALRKQPLKARIRGRLCNRGILWRRWYMPAVRLELLPQMRDNGAPVVGLALAESDMSAACAGPPHFLAYLEPGFPQSQKQSLSLTQMGRSCASPAQPGRGAAGPPCVSTRAPRPRARASWAAANCAPRAPPAPSHRCNSPPPPGLPLPAALWIPTALRGPRQRPDQSPAHGARDACATSSRS